MTATMRGRTSSPPINLTINLSFSQSFDQPLNLISVLLPPLPQEVIAVDKEVIRVLLENQELAGRIRDEVERRTTAVEAQLDGLRKEAAAGLLQRVPSAVAQEMVLQFPGFLQQNAQMERILQAHAHAIEQELEVRARDHLERILAEEKYHEVHQAYFAAFNRKGDQVSCNGAHGVAAWHLRLFTLLSDPTVNLPIHPPTHLDTGLPARPAHRRAP